MTYWVTGNVNDVVLSTHLGTSLIAEDAATLSENISNSGYVGALHDRSPCCRRLVCKA